MKQNNTNDTLNPSPSPSKRADTSKAKSNLRVLTYQQMKDDKMLVVSAQNGNEQAFNALLTNHREDACELARSILFKPNGRLNANQSAEDCVQEASLYAWQNIKSLNSPLSFRPWFRSIVRSECNKLLRQVAKDAKNIDIYTDIERIADVGNVFTDMSLARLMEESPIDYDEYEKDTPIHGKYQPFYQSTVDIVGDELADHYRWAMRQLPIKQRKVIALKTKGYTLKEIAEELNMEVRNVKQNLYHARKKLKKLQETTLKQTIKA